MKCNGNWTWLKPLLGLTTLSATSGCAHVSTPPPAINAYCVVAKPIRYDSRTDSAATVAQIEAHNSTWVCLCEQDCPASAPDTR